MPPFVGILFFFEMPTRLLWSERHAHISVTCCKCGTGFKAARYICKYSLKEWEGLYGHWLWRISVHSQLCSSSFLGWANMVGARRMPLLYRGWWWLSCRQQRNDQHVVSNESGCKETISMSLAMKVDDSTNVRIKLIDWVGCSTLEGWHSVGLAWQESFWLGHMYLCVCVCLCVCVALDLLLGRSILFFCFCVCFFWGGAGGTGGRGKGVVAVSLLSWRSWSVVWDLFS